MDKILLVYEDYADLMAVESALKKVGFDVLGLSSEYAVTEQILAFNPSLVVGSGKGGKVSAVGVGKRLKEMNRWLGKVVLIFPAGFKMDPAELMRVRTDMILEAPVTPIRLLQVIAKVLGHDEGVLLDRFNKVLNTEPGIRGSIVTKGLPSTEEDAIYVKGSIPGEEVGSDIDSEESSNSEHFRFGDRTSASSTQGADGDAQSALQDGFDLDLKALEQELMGGGVPAVEQVPASEDALEDIQVKARAEVAKAQARASERTLKYKEMIKDVKVSPKSTVTRVEARRRAKIMNADVDAKKANELDELRREFTKALFKK